MGVIINEFEAIAEAPVPNDAESTAAEETGSGDRQIDPAVLAAALRDLAEQSARVWAH
jgi:hypothetical protein